MKTSKKPAKKIKEVPSDELLNDIVRIKVFPKFIGNFIIENHDTNLWPSCNLINFTNLCCR